MTFFSIFTNCASFLARSGPNAPAAFLRKAWPDTSPRSVIYHIRATAHDPVIDHIRRGKYSPKPPLPSHLLVLVVDKGGGGFSTCDAVGMRVWRIE